MGVKTELDFHSYLKKLKSGDEPNSPLTLIDRTTLQLDDENRLYDAKVEITNKIVDVPRLNLQNSSQIDIKDSIICGDLHITQKEGKSTSIILDYCIILGKILIHGLDQAGDNVEITRTNVYELCFNNVHIRSISVSYTHPVRLSIWGSEIESLSTFENFIEFIDIRGSLISRSHFDFRQVVLGNLSPERSEFSIEKAKKNFNPFDFTPLHRKTEASEPDTSNRETLLFLLNSTSVKSSRPEHIRLLHLVNLTTQKEVFSKKAMAVLGSFVHPGRILLLGLLCYLGYAAAYALPTMTFAVGGGSIRGLGIIDALYFSGITFTTIGYGDLAPVGWTRGLAVSEGLIGVLTVSAFLVSLVRRYCD